MKKPRNKDKQLRICTIVLIALFVVYILLDYFNVLTLIGLSPENVNTDIFALMVNTLVVVLLYAITFFVIDKRQLKKEENAVKVGKVLLCNTYKECMNIIKLIENDEMLRKYIVPKVDFKVTGIDDKITNRLQNKPFFSYNDIVKLATEGYIEAQEFDEYLEIRKEYQDIVSMSITFFDKENAVTDLQQDVQAYIEEGKKKLKTQIQALISDLEKQKGNGKEA